MHLPPLLEADGPIVVGIKLEEKVVQLRIRHREPGTAEGSAKLVFRQLAVMVVVNALEEVQELLFCLMHKGAELFSGESAKVDGNVIDCAQMLTVVLDAPVSISVYCLHHVVEEMVRILQSYRRVLATVDRVEGALAYDDPASAALSSGKQGRACPDCAHPVSPTARRRARRLHPGRSRFLCASSQGHQLGCIMAGRPVARGEACRSVDGR